MTGGYEEPETRRAIEPVSPDEVGSTDAGSTDAGSTTGREHEAGNTGYSGNVRPHVETTSDADSAGAGGAARSSATENGGASGKSAATGNGVTEDEIGPVLHGTYVHASPDYGPGSTTSEQPTSHISPPWAAQSQSSPSPSPHSQSGPYTEPETSPGTYPHVEHPPPSYVDPSASNVASPPHYPAAPPYAGGAPAAPPYGEPAAGKPSARDSSGGEPPSFAHGQGPYGNVPQYGENAPSRPQGGTQPSSQQPSNQQSSGARPVVGAPGPYPPPQQGVPTGPYAVAGDLSEAQGSGRQTSGQQFSGQQFSGQQFSGQQFSGQGQRFSEQQPPNQPSPQQVQDQHVAGQSFPAQQSQTQQPQTQQPQMPPGQPVPPGSPPQQPFPQQPGNSADQSLGSDLSSAQLLRQGKRPPQSGWRRAVYLASGRSINLGESSADVHRRELISRINQPLHGCYKIAMLSLKGGVGKTTTTATLGSTFSSLRGDRVIAVDANPDRGTLSQKIPLETTATVRHLLRDSQMVRKYSDVRSYTSQGPSRLEILASEQDPAVSEAFSEDDYRRTITMLEHFYNVVLTDCGTGLMHSAMKGVLDIADSLVIISSSSIDGARSASATLDWLDAHGYGQLVARSVSVINSVRPGSSKVDVDKLTAHFESRCRAVAKIPFDEHLEEGAEIELDQLAGATRLALLELAAIVADDFPQAPGRHP